MRKELMRIAVSGLALLVGGHVASATTCEGHLTPLQTGGILISGQTDAEGAVFARVTGPHGVSETFYLVLDPVAAQSAQLADLYGSFAALAEFAVEYGRAYQVSYLDRKGHVLCVSSMQLDQMQLDQRVLAIELVDPADADLEPGVDPGAVIVGAVETAHVGQRPGGPASAPRR